MISASIFLVTHAETLSTSTLNQDKIYPTPFVIGAGQTYEFIVTLEYWRYLTSPYDDTKIGPPISNPIFSRAIYIGSYWLEAHNFEVQPPKNTFTS